MKASCGKLIHLYLFYFLFLNLFFAPKVFALANLKKVRFSSDKTKTRIVFDLSKAIQYKDTLFNNKQLFLLEIFNCKNWSKQTNVTCDTKVVKNIQIKENNNKSTTIQISIKNLQNYKIFPLKPFKNKPHRLVIDFFPKKNSKISSNVNIQIEIKRKIVVIDPGHGGQDPGAIGYRGIKEKDIVLRIAKNLQSLINETLPNVQAYLTRKGDYYIPLRDRVKFAHQYKADVFISLHINASRKKRVEGASVYYLSEMGASDKAADLLAKRENESDLIAGIKFSEDKLLNTILIDLVQTYTINESVKLCQFMLNGLIEEGFYNEGIKCANFAVLKSPSIPSILLEIGYITNIKDAKKINNPKYQKKIAKKLFDSLAVYFKKEHFSEQTISKITNKDSKNLQQF